MQFASAIPWWLATLVAAALSCLAWLSYRRPPVPLSHAQKAALVALRAASLIAVFLFLCRPVLLMPSADGSEIVVPVVVDVSRSMSVGDVGGGTRLDRAAAIVRDELLPALSPRFTPELHAVGEGLAPTALDQLRADARKTELTAAIEEVGERYRGRRLAGIILLSDGGDTGAHPGAAPGRVPVFAVGIGSPDGLRDREIISVAAGDPRLDQSSVDLHVAALSHQYGRAPFELRVLANGRQVLSRTVAPAADGSPIDEVFTVSPDPVTPTVFTVAVAPEADEAIVENNTRSVMVSPPGRKRRVLAIQGAPGHEHGFLGRALSADPGLDLDVVVRKGKDETGGDTFLIQAAPGRVEALTGGFPSTRAALSAYDAVILANIDADALPRAQLAQTAEFVSERGGGLLVLGGRSFAQRGLIGTPLEIVLPIELNDRRGGLTRTALPGGAGAQNAIALTDAGVDHPVMRMGGGAANTREVWSRAPTLASVAPLGGPRPGATVLAATVSPGGAIYPVVAVQRYGRGRSMVFGGEATWRWRMMQASTDRTHELFWRQAVRWLATAAPAPVELTVPVDAEPNDDLEIALDVRDAAFVPAADATVEATLTAPGGAAVPLAMRRDSAVAGRFAAAVRPTEAGLYRVRADARRGATSLGVAERWLHVGGSDRELADPRLNEGVLRRLARASGGQYVRAADAATLLPALEAAEPHRAEPERRDLWHEPWAFALLISLLSAEWVLRRRWGMR